MQRIVALFILTLCATYSVAQTNVDKKIDSLLSKMSITEKIGQTSLRGTSSRVKTLPEELKQAVREGKIGSVINVLDRNNVDELQRIAVKESPHGIPLLIGRDVIHGYKTIFPIPLGQAATWNAAIVERGARIAADEASTNGIRWTFAPMLDISRDPRWGRIAESSGEDPYLTSVLGVAAVKGFQGTDMTRPTSVAACAKHFVGYGAAEGGRDYNSTIIPENLLRDVYLKPFNAAVDAGAATVMASFNDINGVPASGNKFILKNILRDEWKFNGFVVSDWNGVIEMITHGYCADPKEAAYKAANASLDMEMTSTTYENNLAQLINEGKITEAQLNDMVRNILRVKFELGLFKSPYVDRSRDATILSDDHRAAAKEAAIESMVLLKNNGDVLPLAKNKKIALVGPLANAPHEQLGTWIFDGKDADAITPATSLQQEFGNNLSFTPALAHSRDRATANFKQAVDAAKKADVILFFGGEESILSGEAHSRADLNLPGAQEQLIKELKSTGKPLVLVIFAGRPITLGNILKYVDAIVMGWHPGTMAGPAITDVLTGKANPSGRLPLTWPKAVGQIPIYYNHFNTGRPATTKSFVQLDSIPVGAWQSSLGNTSHYLDLGFLPQFPFGFGLSYTTFEYTNMTVSAPEIPMTGSVTIRATITNTGKRSGTEVVQLYVQDVVGDVIRPVRELKRFARITLEPGQRQEVSFTLKADDLAFYNQAMKSVTEPGLFRVWIGKNAAEGMEGSFSIK